jgi:uncharacterized membrane protein YoaK (UPF0700 family)
MNGFEMTSLICFAMGVQNALVTKLSGARVRTTHMTGVTTDIGIEAAKAIQTWREGTDGMGFTASLWHLGWLWRDDDLRKLRLHVAVLGSFLAGATLGPLLYLSLGHIAMLVPCTILLLLAAFDGWVGLTGRLHEDDQPINSMT